MEPVVNGHSKVEPMVNGHSRPKVKGLVERLKDGENIIIAEGYMWEFERRGYLKSGGFVPEVVIDYPEMVTSMHKEFVHAGSDVVEAFTYYGHREKLRLIGREDDLERLNRGALRLARAVADETGTLMAGNICNTGLYSVADPGSHDEARAMFKEQVEWAVEEGCDYIIGETFSYLGEAILALEAIQTYGKGVPAVITLTPYIPDITLDDVSFPEACKTLEDAGAAVVGLNCSRGPASLLPLLREVRKVCKGPIAALPVPFRTNEANRTFMSFIDEKTGERMYPTNITSFLCNRSEVRKFAKECREMGVQYIGLCCGNAANMLREVAEEYGRVPPSSKYAPKLSTNIIIGDAALKNKEHLKVRKFSLGDFTPSEIKTMNLKASQKNGELHHEAEEEEE